MKKIILIIILLAIIIFTVGGYHFIAPFNALSKVAAPTPTADLSNLPICQKDQLSTNLSTQGAAGNIYATLELTNTKKTACTIMLGNTVTILFNAKNIATHYVQPVPSEMFVLAPFATAYSQIHYPNGPQCQSGIKEEPITILYKTEQVTVPFINPAAQKDKLIVPTCLSKAEQTTIDIWPLSKKLINP